MINGILTHEAGCPDAWKDTKRECKECGTSFIPTERDQTCCDHFCYTAYNNITCDCQACSEEHEGDYI